MQAKDIPTTIESASIKKFKPNLSDVPKPGHEHRDKVFHCISRNASHLIQLLEHIWTIRVICRVPSIFKLRFDAFNYREQFDIYLSKGKEEFIETHLSEFKEYLKVENRFFSSQGAKAFDEEELTDQLKSARKILCKEIDRQYNQRKIMNNVREAKTIDYTKALGSQLRRKLTKLEETSCLIIAMIATSMTYGSCELLLSQETVQR